MLTSLFDVHKSFTLLPGSMFDLTVLDESDVCCLFSEALTADVETVLSDETSLVSADTAGTGALAVGSWAGVPDTLVRHDCGSV
jgi:hypothetical protein